ncbi:hypothetical protein V8E52_000889 [Russula decolorans]
MRENFVCPYDGCPTIHFDANKVDLVSAAPSSPPPPSPSSPSPPPLRSSSSSSPPPSLPPPPSPPSLLLSPSPSPPPSPPPPPPEPHGPQEQHRKIYHPFLNGLPCDANGNLLPPGTPPPPPQPLPETPWEPYANSVQFKTADFLYRRAEMSGGNIDELLDIWAESMMESGEDPPFKSHEHMYETIDATRHGDAPWNCLVVSYNGKASDACPSWQMDEWEVFYRNPDVVLRQMLENPDFKGQIDYAVYVGLDKTGKRYWSDFMLGNYAYQQSTQIYNDDPSTKGALYCPIILGSDKTIVSVATSHVEYHPVYLSIGLVHNTIRRTHRNAVIPIGFLAIPKADRKYDKETTFRNFKRQMYHDTIHAILNPIKAAMTTPVIRRCPDGHFRRVIYDLAAYIADYPEQIYLACVVQNWCPKCTAMPADLGDLVGQAGRRSHDLTAKLKEIITSKLLWDEYGIDNDITGAFKDNLVQWVADYLYLTHRETRANNALDDIDRRVAAAPPFPGLRRFPQGRRFKQWTGDDSKALMKVFLNAILGHVPTEMVQCVAAFLDACYLVRRADINESDITELQMAIRQFHEHRETFRALAVRPTGFSLPRQHSLIHYPHQIREFGAPAGLCSSITESRHITAIKRPWRRSNHHNALGQMLLTIQRLDKLKAARNDFVHRGLLPPSHAPPPKPVLMPEEDEDGGPIDEHVTGTVTLARRRPSERKIPRDLAGLANHINKPDLVELTRCFLHDQIYPDGPPANEMALEDTLTQAWGMTGDRVRVMMSRGAGERESWVQDNVGGDRA